MHLSRSSGGIKPIQRVTAVIREHSGVKLVQYEGHRVQEGFGEHVVPAAPKEAAETLWNATVDHATVSDVGRITFTFRNQMQITI